MYETRDPSRSTRRREARQRARFRFLSFGAGVAVTLLVGVAVLLNGLGGDLIASAARSFTAPPAAAIRAAPAASVSRAAALTPTARPAAAPQSEPTAAPITVTLDVQNEAAMEVGDTGQLRPALDPPDPAASLVWKSSDEKVVKVDRMGAVEAVGVGTAQIALWIDGSEEASAVVDIQVGHQTGGTVWIPKTGKKYHSTPSCSNMKNPSRVSLPYAKSHGYGKCRKCW